MKCRELMKTEVECCPLSATAKSVAARMRDRNIGFVPVCDDAGSPVGTITDRDLVLRVLADGHSPDMLLAVDVMSRGVVCCRDEDELQVAELQMSRYKKSRVVCTDARGRLVGVISLSDIAQVESAGRSSAVLRSVAQREVGV